MDETLSQNQLREIEQRLAADLKDFGDLARRTVQKAWEIGNDLREAKDLLNHGEWMPWLEARGIDKSMSSRFMRICEEYQISQLEKFESVSDALKALPKPAPKPLPITESRPEGLTSAEKRLMERDEHIERIKRLEEQTRQLTDDLDTAQRQVLPIDHDRRPQLAAGVAQIAAIKAKLNICVAEWGKQATMMKELRGVFSRSTSGRRDDAERPCIRDHTRYEIRDEVYRQANAHGMIVRVDNCGGRTPSYGIVKPFAGSQSNAIVEKLRRLGIYEHRAKDKFIPYKYVFALRKDRLERQKREQANNAERAASDVGVRRGSSRVMRLA